MERLLLLLPGAERPRPRALGYGEPEVAHLEDQTTEGHGLLVSLGGLVEHPPSRRVPDANERPDPRPLACAEPRSALTSTAADTPPNLWR
jgi:hypothetical protein